MKKAVKSIIAVAIALCVIIGLSTYSRSKYVNAQNEVKPSLTIENTTPLEMKNVKVQLNKKETIELGTIGAKESVDVPLQKEADPIVLTKVEGEASIAGKFAGTISGWVKEETNIQICLDENMNVYMNSNVETE